jgi:hypothetical protein
MTATPPGYSLTGLGERLRKRFEITDRSLDEKMRRLIDALMAVSSHREAADRYEQTE